MDGRRKAPLVFTEHGALQAANVLGFELGSVEMQENSERAKRRSKKPGVQLAFSGPKLWNLWVTVWKCADRDRSTIKEVKRESGTIDFELIGVQHFESLWDQQRMELVKQRHSRVDGQGLFVPSIQGIFRIEEFPAWVFCTDYVKRLIEEHGFTNVSFLEMGDTLE